VFEAKKEPRMIQYETELGDVQVLIIHESECSIF
jgi:hypothetical protein